MKVCSQIFFSVLTAIILVLNCLQDKPAVLTSGEYPCHFCRMNITDLRFNAQFLSEKGKHFHCDSLECVLHWSSEENIGTGSMWVADFFKKNNYLRIADAFYLQSNHLLSPMSANVSAYASKNERDKNMSEFTGQALAYAQMRSYIGGLRLHKNLN